MVSKSSVVLKANQYPAFYKVLTFVSTVFGGFSLLILALSSINKTETDYSVGKASYVATLMLFASAFWNALGYGMSKASVAFSKHKPDSDLLLKTDPIKRIWFIFGGALMIVGAGTFLWLIFELGQMFDLHDAEMLATFSVSVVMIGGGFALWILTMIFAKEEDE